MASTRTFLVGVALATGESAGCPLPPSQFRGGLGPLSRAAPVLKASHLEMGTRLPTFRSHSEGITSDEWDAELAPG